MPRRLVVFDDSTIGPVRYRAIAQEATRDRLQPANVLHVKEPFMTIGKLKVVASTLLSSGMLDTRVSMPP